MSETKQKFTDFTFGSLVYNLRLEHYINSLSEYNIKLNTLLTSDQECPLFLDTNVLLRYYETSLKFRGRLFNYFKERQSRIILTNTVQMEFVRNREDIISRFISQSLTNFKKDYETRFVKGFSNYYNDIKSHLDDFPEIGKSIEEIHAKVKETYIVLEGKIDNIEDELKELKKNDEYLNLFLKVNLLDSLNEAEIKILKEQFDHLGRELDSAKKDRESKTASIFPGYLDKKRKGKNPYGDYLIFHEILKYMKENDTDAIFLTYDAKEDWLHDNGETHSHYIQIAYEATGKSLFILDAERYFQDRLKATFDPVSYANMYNDMVEQVHAAYKLFFSNLQTIYVIFASKDEEDYHPFLMRLYSEKNIDEVGLNYCLKAINYYDNSRNDSPSTFSAPLATILPTVISATEALEAAKSKLLHRSSNNNV